MKRIVVAILLLVIIPIYGFANDEEVFNCAGPVDSTLTSLPNKGGYCIKLIHVTSADSFAAAPDSTILSARHFALASDLETYLTRQSGKTWTVEYILRPQDGANKYMWVLDHNAADYRSASWCIANGQYKNMWQYYYDIIPPNEANYAHYGELEAEVLYKIKTAYEHSLPNPFDGADLVCFILDTGRMVSAQNTGAGGIGITFVNISSEQYFSGMGNDNGRLNGVNLCMRWNYFNHFGTEAMLAHELGHKLFGIGHRDGEVRDPEDVDETTYFFANYDIMTSSIPQDQGFIPYSIVDRIHMGWVNSPIVVTNNMRDVVMYDMSDPYANSYQININDAMVDICSLPNPLYFPQYINLAYYSGNDEYGELDKNGLPIYKSKGLHVTWTINDNFYYTRSACGRYANRDSSTCDPSEMWVEDTRDGYDNIESWPGRTLADHISYTGDQGDFFGITSGATEFSYATNPNTAGVDTLMYCDGNGNTIGIGVNRSPRDAVNSVYVQVKEEYQDYAVVDILLAPYEHITSPNGGERIEVGDTLSITWEDKHPIMSTVDIYLSVDGGQTYPVTIIQNANATLHSFEWAPSDSVATDEAIIKVVYHNTNSNYTCDDVSDSTFTIIPDPVTQYVNKSTSTNLDYEGTPYSSVVLDYNQDGKTDLFISIKDDYSKLYQSTAMTGDGVPYFSDATQSTFGTYLPQLGLRGVAIADIDNDGDEDIFAAADNNARLYSSYCDSNQVWKYDDVASSVGISNYVTDTWSGTWGDYDQDGDVDLYVTRAQTSGGSQTPDATNVYPLRDYLLKNNLNISGLFADASSAAGGMSTSVFATITASWADIDNDGDLDLLVPSIMDYNGNETARLYTNNGNGTFTQNFTSRFGGPQLWHISGMSWFDADNDADLDVAFSSQTPSVYATTQRVFINEAGYYSEENTNLTLHSAGVNAYDHDLDGHMDLLYSPMSSSDTPHLIQNISSPAGFECRDISSTSGLAEVGRVDGVVVSDFNRGGANTDGDLDLFLGRPESSGEYFFRASKSSDNSDTSVNHSVSVKLFSGGPNNTTAIGARVVASYNGIEYVQQVDGGSGHGGQNDRILTFGLGDYDGSVDLTIKWPLGYTQHETVPADSVDIGRPVKYEDETPVTVVTNSLQVDYVHQPLDGKLEWTLIWDTDYNSKAILDAVEINGPGWENPWVTYPQTSQIVRLATGGYRHTVVISDFDCAIGSYTFKVRSSTDATTGAWSATKSKTVRFCLAN